MKLWKMVGSGGLLVLLFLLAACNLPQRGVGTPYAPAPALYTAAAQTVDAGIPSAALATPEPERSLAATPTPSPVVLLAATSTSAPTLPGPQSIRPRPAYDLAVRWEGDGRLFVDQRIRFHNPADMAVDWITLQVEAARKPGVFTLNRASWVTASASIPLTATLQGAALDLALPGQLGPDALAEITLSYTLIIPNASSFLGQTDRQINLGDWFPRLPVYQPGIGWVIHDQWPIGETQLFTTADYSVRLLLPEEFTVAASAASRQEEGWRVYALAGARTFTFSFSPSYLVTTQTMPPEELQDARPAVTLLHYGFPNYPKAGAAALETMRRSVSLYSELFGPYPYDTLSMVEGDFFDGMETDGLFFLGQEYYSYYDNTPANYLVALTAHEVSHQWWYSVVGNDQALEPWLDEALATYSELLYYERYHPEQVEWWWQYRVRRFGPGGWVDSRVYDFTDFRAYINAVYLRGAMFLRDLRAQMGEEPFFAFLKAYAAENAGRIASAPDFWAVLGRFVDPTDVESLRRQYFR